MAKVTVNAQSSHGCAEPTNLADVAIKKEHALSLPAVGSVPRPIFVVGSMRSGASLLTLAIGQHSSIVQALETRWFERLAIGLQQAYSVGSSPPDTSHLDIAGIEIEDFFELFGTTIDRMMLNAASERIPRPTRWVDGTPTNSMSLFALHRLFPHAKFIHVLRNASEVVASLSSKENKRVYKSRHIRMTDREAGDHWLQTVTACVKAERAFGSDRVLRIRRNALLSDPEQTIRRCLEFLGEPFDPACMRPLRPPVGLDPTTVDGDGQADFMVQVALPPSLDLLNSLLLDEATPNYAGDDGTVVQLELEFSKRCEREARASAHPLSDAGRSLKSKRPAIQASVEHWLPRVLRLGPLTNLRNGNKPAVQEPATGSFPNEE